jgi:glycerophosphoryl diester phosphodiesterase
VNVSLDAFRRGKGQPPLLFGHRGVRGPLPENTLAAFSRAAEEGADGIELDVRLARSGEVVVLHDPDLTRVTHQRDRRVAAELSWDQIREVDLDGEKIPRLEDVFALARDKRLLVNVELKHDEPRRSALVWAVRQVLKRSGFPRERVILSSFHPKLVLLTEALLPSIGRAFLCHHGQRHQHPFAVARALRPHAIHPEWTLLLDNPSSPHRPRGRLAPPVVSVWTVNEEAAARTLAQLPGERVDSLITDRPGALRRFLANDRDRQDTLSNDHPCRLGPTAYLDGSHGDRRSCSCPRNRSCTNTVGAPRSEPHAGEPPR